MSETLLSVGLDVGTTTTQLVVSELTVENRASGFAVPDMEITKRNIRYESPVHFTPLIREELVDGDGIAKIVLQEYENAGIRKKDVDTGAVIITGETSRKENAATVLRALSDFAGEFVVATAGPDLESVLAAKGAGAVEYSQRTGKTVLHMDIGGGTSNLALIENGKILRTGCLNVGGRLLKFDKTGRLTYRSPVLEGVEPWEAAQWLAQGLEMAVGLRPATELLRKLQTKEAATPWIPPKAGAVISFSGGVADCIETVHSPLAFGDIGPALGQAIAGSLLCQGEYMIGAQTIRATVIGAGCHSAQLSGSTVFAQGVKLPVKNLPVAVFTKEEQESSRLPELIRQRMAEKDAPVVVLGMPGYEAPTYEKVAALADKICRGVGEKPVYICLEADMAKALGHSLSLRLPKGTPCLCIDGLKLGEECFLDIGSPVGPAISVVIKTLIMSN